MENKKYVYLYNHNENKNIILYSNKLDDAMKYYKENFAYNGFEAVLKGDFREIFPRGDYSDIRIESKEYWINVDVPKGERYYLEEITINNLIIGNFFEGLKSLQSNKYEKTKKEYPKPKRSWTFFPLQSKFEESSLIEVEYETRFDDELVKSEIRICKTCMDEGHHEKQGDAQDVHDCKSVFYDKDGKQRGQCCCYSYEHGVRKQ